MADMAPNPAVPSREDLLDLNNLQTIQEIAVRFKTGVSLPELFNTCLLTLMGRLRLKRAAIYMSTLPASRFKLFLWKGRPFGGALPETIDVADIPAGRLWRGVPPPMAVRGFSMAWILSRSSSAGHGRPSVERDMDVGRSTGLSSPPRPEALIFMGADRDEGFAASDMKFVEALNDQIQGILNLLDSFSGGSAGNLMDGDESAALMQKKFLEETVCPEKDAHCRILFRPSRNVGGDFYDFYPFKNGFGVALADVVGHGIPAAVWTYAIRDRLRQILAEESAVDPSRPAAVLEHLNGMLLKNQKSEIPVSICYGFFNRMERTFTYASAGMDYPLLFRPDQGQVFELPAGGLFLGCVSGVRFSEHTLSIQDRDILMIYTDGLQPLAGQAWRQETLEQIRAAAASAPAKSSGVDIAYECLAKLAESPPAMDGQVSNGTWTSAVRPLARDDDQTALVFSPVLDPSPAMDGQVSNGTWTSAVRPAGAALFQKLVIPSDLRHLSSLRIFVRNVLQSIGRVTAEETFAIRFTTEDAVVNAIQHGYAGRADGEVAVTARLEKDRLSITVADQGKGFNFDPARIPKFTTKEDYYRPSGRGLFMMFQLMDQVEIESRPAAGTTVKLAKDLRSKNAHGPGI